MPDPNASNIAIAKALGLDVTHIQRGGVTLRLTDAGPMLDVTYFLTNADGKRFTINDEVVTELKRYKLIPLEDDE